MDISEINDMIKSGRPFDPEDVKGNEIHVQSIQLDGEHKRDVLREFISIDVVNFVVMRYLYSDSLMNYKPIPIIEKYSLIKRLGYRILKTEHAFGEKGYVNFINKTFDDFKEKIDPEKPLHVKQQKHNEWCREKWLQYLSGESIDRPVAEPMLSTNEKISFMNVLLYDEIGPELISYSISKEYVYETSL